MKGLFHGMMPRMLRRTFMAAFTWAFYEQVLNCINMIFCLKKNFFLQIEKMVVKATVY